MKVKKHLRLVLKVSETPERPVLGASEWSEDGQEGVCVILESNSVQ